MDVISLFEQLAGLAGFTGLVAAIVNVFKSLGVVKDGQALTVTTLLNLIGIAGLIAAGLFNVDVANIDTALEQAAGILTALIALIGMVGGSKFWHWLLKKLNLPALGYSHSKKK